MQTRMLLDLIAARATNLRAPGEGPVDMAAIELALLMILQTLTEQADFGGFTQIATPFVSLVPAEATYVLPDDWARFVWPSDDVDSGLMVRVGSEDRPLRYRDPMTFQRLRQGTLGVPAFFTLTHPRLVRFDPVPDAAYVTTGIYIRQITSELLQETIPLQHATHLIPLVLAQLAQERGHASTATLVAQADQARAQLLAANVVQQQRVGTSHPVLDLLALRAHDLQLVDAATGRVDITGLEQRLLSIMRGLSQVWDFDFLTVTDTQFLTLIPGTRTYPLPPAFVRFVRPTDDRASGLMLVDGGITSPLRYRDPQQFVATQQLAPGTPRFFTLLDQAGERVLALDPPPAAATATVTGIYLRTIDRTLLTRALPIEQSECLVDMVLGQLAYDRNHPQASTLLTKGQEAEQRLIAANTRQRQRLSHEHPLLDMLLLRAQDVGLTEEDSGKVDVTSLLQRVVHILETLSDTYDLDALTMTATPLVTTQSGQRDYALPPDFKRFINPRDHDESGLFLIRNGQSRPLGYRDPWTLERQKTETAGIPAFFTRLGGVIRLDPPPDDNDGAQYTLSGLYIRHTSRETLETDIQQLPAALLLDMALAQYALDKGDVRAPALLVESEKARTRLLNHVARQKQRFQPQIGRLAHDLRHRFTISS